MEIQKHQLLKNLVIIDGILQIRQLRSERDWLESSGELSNVRGIVILLDMLTGSGNGHRIQNFKKVKVQHPQKVLCCSVRSIPFAPGVKCSLGISENFVNGTGCIELIVNKSSVALIGKRQLILQIIEAVVNRRCRQHQHFRLDTFPDHCIQKLQITVFFFVIFSGELATVAEIMRFVNYNQIIIGPIDTSQIQTIGYSVGSVQVRMIENIIAQTVRCNRIIDVIILVCVPVVSQFFGAKHQHRLISVFIIFDNRQGGECFTKTNTVCQYTTVIFFEFVDDGERRIFLEVKQHTPDFAVLEAGCLIGQYIFRDIL